MLRSFTLVVLCATLSFFFAFPATSSAAGGNGCESVQATFAHGKWSLSCNSSGACGTGGCGTSMARDATGNYESCRCREGAMSKCCQLIGRPASGEVEVAGKCRECNQTGACTLIMELGAAQARCNQSGSQS